MAVDGRFSTFKEFSPLYYLLNAIPAKVQKGFRNVAVHLTALDANKDFIAVGTNIGMLYLYSRRMNKMTKYNLEGKTEVIKVVKLLACFDDLVAVGTASGRVTLFQLVSHLPGRNKQLRRFDVVGIHKSNITALAWSSNGMKLFSGDELGKVVYAAVDLDQGICSPTVILEDASSIVQLDYTQKILLVSTCLRSILIYTEQNVIRQVGTQPRKIAGRFGACFIPGLCKQTDINLYASRPGLRLWKSDVHGAVQSTLILKSIFTSGVKPFELFPRPRLTTNLKGAQASERNLGLLKCCLRDGWVLSWNEASIYVIDAVNQALIGGLEGFSSIISVSCTEDEIFMLTHDRDIIRISSKPEGLIAGVKSQSLLTTTCSESVQERMSSTDSRDVQNDDKTSGSVSFEMRKSSSSEPEHWQSIEHDGGGGQAWDETGERRGSLASEPRSRSSSLNSSISVFSHVTTPEQQVGALSSPVLLSKVPETSERFGAMNVEDFNQQLVVVSVKKKKKRKQASLASENSSQVKHETDFSNSSVCSEPALLSDFAIDSSVTTTCDLSEQLSLLSSSLDHLASDSPERESQISTDSNNMLQELDTCLCVDATQPPVPTPHPLPSHSSPESLRESNLTNEDLCSSDHPRFTECSDPVSSVKLLNSCDEKDEHSDKVSLFNCCEPVTSLQRSAVGTVIDETYDSDPLALRSQTPQNAVLTCTLSLHESLRESSETYLDERHALLMRILSPDIDVNKQEAKEFSQLYVSYNEPHLPGTAEGAGRMETVGSGDSGSWKRENAPEPCLSSSDEDDIYGRAVSHSVSETSMAELLHSRTTAESLGLVSQDLKNSADEMELLKSDQFAESWMGYSGPGYNMLSLVVSEKHIWCLDCKGGLYCSPFFSTGLRWQKFEDGVQQVAVSPSGVLLWKIEQKSSKAYACGKVTMKGKRHWYEALPNAAYVALSDDAAWIIQTNGELYLQTGLSADRPCARAVRVDCPCPLMQIISRNNVVWALTEQRTVLYRKGISSFCPEGEQWMPDVVSERQMLELVCIALGGKQTVWALDSNGNLWFRTGISSKKPQGEHYGLRGLRSVQHLPGDNSSHADCGYSCSGTSGESGRQTARCLMVTTVSVSAKSHQCQRLWRVDYIGQKRVPRSQRKPVSYILEVDSTTRNSISYKMGFCCGFHGPY
ncbi:tectonin beta-propeller repeat-containing protein 2 isoform X2 [Amblyraja radiata]|uniref:tectonin beta-propeller repeat-containing protein 2 isoform X2 n=1 Tax=Amblyraja radiata TaxID=386614 RepID=UPI001403737B|nr:tectonin beta-propeller repeat-containing protein 2 isoform X2 [Amblyraja radiata]